MRLLHVGSGFRPWRRGGLVAYMEDLMSEQVRRGHEVVYFFSGRQYPFVRRTRIRSWERDGIRMREVIDSPLFDHGRQPERELSEPRTEKLFETVLKEVEPDVVHFGELAGLPTSLLELAKEHGVPTLFTLQDYYALCPNFKLLDSAGETCLRRQVGDECVATLAADPRPPRVLIEATIRNDLPRLPLRITRPLARKAASRLPHGRADSRTYQERRDRNVQRLNAVDALIAMSRRVEEIYMELGVAPARLRTVHLTLTHFETLRPRRSRGPKDTLTFGTLSGLESEEKGASLLLGALQALRGRGERRFRLVVHGHLDARAARDVIELPEVDARGHFRVEELGRALDEIDVGIVPSVWEEAYGYVGMEMLAKGIPVIGNAIGGIVDYVQEGETGWLNRSLSSEELAEVMQRLIDSPEEVDELARKVRSQRDRLIKPMADHADEMDAIYRELIYDGATASM